MVRIKSLKKLLLIILVAAFFLFLAWLFLLSSTTINSWLGIGQNNLLLSDSEGLYLSSEIDKKISSNIFENAEKFQIVDERIYYFDSEKRQIGWYEDGDMGELLYTKAKGNTEFIVNDKNIAWSDTYQKNDQTISDLYSSRIDGDNKKQLAEEVSFDKRYINPICWKKDNLYYSIQSISEGELMQTIGSSQIYRLNVSDEDENLIFEKGVANILDFDSSKNKVLYFIEKNNQQEIYIAEGGEHKLIQPSSADKMIVSGKFNRNNGRFYLNFSDFTAVFYNKNIEKITKLENYQALCWLGEEIILKNEKQKNNLYKYNVGSGQSFFFSNKTLVVSEN